MQFSSSSRKNTLRPSPPTQKPKDKYDYKGDELIDFMKRNTIVEMNQSSYLKYKNDVKRMAEIENLYAHKLSVKIRQNK